MVYSPVSVTYLVRGLLMKLLSTTAAAAIVLLGAQAASAATYNFKELADGNVYGESAYDSLTVGDVTVTATKNGNEALVYLDADNAGMGVCGSLLSGASLGANGSSGANVCSDSSDDSIQWQSDESLTFTANDDGFYFGSIWFNHNHDGTALDETDWEWEISSDLFATYSIYFADLISDDISNGQGASGDDWRFDLDYFLTAGSYVTFEMIAGPNAYVSGISAVPLPAAGWLLLGGLGGLAAMKRRKKAA